jgi:mono/diheme cytochrome c family protein
MRKMIYGALAVAAAATVTFVTAGAQQVDVPGNVSAGRAFAIKTCSQCHLVTGRRSLIPKPNGPPDFVAIADTPSITPTSLYVFLHTPHPNMPNLILSQTESHDVIAYILSLRKEAPQPQ